ncbi:hypothetical protein SAMN02745216_03556 [Desulfatibacillum alkenivorans DSM 16219]|jgi:hypothetical protein|uniref:Uncharacterized protein n=1 Tax=Desulfatibacillum alkenivorans DSM 16219 TaxID=1121393 RepID=A0A1M6SWZ7_9BACT|nr:hypothetical protein [Desulfatibacillum alkenivorans]SHK49206.1 hypothetical protein SAMN02745216_03556 [Desulfatibacillum alkenivorans DSM 16219]
MDFFKKLFKENPQPTQDITHLGRVVANKIDNLVMDVFNAHQGRLCFEPNGFIVPAVWGGREKGELSPVQEEIYQKVEPAIDEIIERLKLKKMDESQEYAIGLMLRWILISKITHMVELRKKRRIDNLSTANESAYHLDSMDPMGTC